MKSPRILTSESLVFIRSDPFGGLYLQLNLIRSHLSFDRNVLQYLIMDYFEDSEYSEEDLSKYLQILNGESGPKQSSVIFVLVE